MKQLSSLNFEFSSILSGFVLALSLAGCSVKLEESRPNILFCISDDQSWLHTSAMGDPVVKTPAFDKVAREGILFTNAYCDAPSCGPSRSAILTGQHIWRLEEAGNIHSILPEKFPRYSDLLENAGYVTGSYSKGWSPGKFKNDTGWVHSGQSKDNPAGKSYTSFKEFFQAKPQDQPFCFWLGSTDAHRGYKLNSGLESGMDPSKVIVPEHLPDDLIVRKDMLDYYYEVQRWDTTVWEALTVIEEAGELENTLVVISSDNGMPFPRAKATLYDFGTHMPMAVSWPYKIANPGRKYEGFIHLSDLAATFLEAAGLDIPDEMTAKSLMDVFYGSEKKPRESAYTAMERHDGCRIGGKGYPCRALRTVDYLYIRNYEPDRWPSGNPDAKYCARAIPFGEVDSSPTKTLMMEKEEDFKEYYNLSFGMRPAEELYDLKVDPGQINNVAGLEEYAEVKEKLSKQLQAYTTETGDPRALGEFAPWDYYAYYGAVKNKHGWKVNDRPQ